MIRTFLALMLLFSAGAPNAAPPRLQAVLAHMDQLLKAHIQAGRSQGSLKQLLTYVQTQNPHFGQNAAFLEKKALILMQTGDYEGYQETLLKIPPGEIQDPSNLFNALQAHWPAEIPRCTTILTRMLKLAPDTLDDWVHNSLTQFIFLTREEGPAADRLLAELSRRFTLEQHPLFAGLMLARRVSHTPPTTPQALDEVLVKVHGLKGAHADRYRLLILQKLLQEGHKGPQVRAALDTLATALGKRLEDLPKSPDPRRALTRYLLAFTHHLQARALGPGSGDALPHLRLSAAFSPDRNDRSVSYAYFYDRVLLNGMETFVPSCTKALLLENRTEEALAVMARGALENPGLLPALKGVYSLTPNNAPFREYWLKTLEQALPPAPPLMGTTLEGKAFSLENMRGSWILLDFWGTWCSACIQELPALENLHQTQSRCSEPLQRLHLLALSVRDSQEAVRNFMKERGYHFPTLPAGNGLLKAFSIIHFPTKILVTPQGKWLLIANGKWKEDVQAITGITL